MGSSRPTCPPHSPLLHLYPLVHHFLCLPPLQDSGIDVPDIGHYTQPASHRSAIAAATTPPTSIPAYSYPTPRRGRSQRDRSSLSALPTTEEVDNAIVSGSSTMPPGMIPSYPQVREGGREGGREGTRSTCFHFALPSQRAHHFCSILRHEAFHILFISLCECIFCPLLHCFICGLFLPSFPPPIPYTGAWSEQCTELDDC